MNSILGQTLSDLELLVVDDGSTDNTAEVVGSYDDERVRYLRLEHVGIARSLNRGLEEVQSGLVAVHDADDWSMPSRLERQVEILETRPAVAVVGCVMKEVDEGGRELSRRLPVAAGDVRNALRFFNPVPNTSAAYRRDAVLEVGGYDPRFRYANDYDLWMRLADRHVIYNIGEELACRVLASDNFGQTHEREQIAEGLRIRAARLRRSPSLRGVAGMARPSFSYVLPLGLKRSLRRSRGQAPI